MSGLLFSALRDRTADPLIAASVQGLSCWKNSTNVPGSTTPLSESENKASKARTCKVTRTQQSATHKGLRVSKISGANTDSKKLGPSIQRHGHTHAHTPTGPLIYGKCCLLSLTTNNIFRSHVMRWWALRGLYCTLPLLHAHKCSGWFLLRRVVSIPR